MAPCPDGVVARATRFWLDMQRTALAGGAVPYPDFDPVKTWLLAALEKKRPALTRPWEQGRVQELDETYQKLSASRSPSGVEVYDMVSEVLGVLEPTRSGYYPLHQQSPRIAGALFPIFFVSEDLTIAELFCLLPLPVYPVQLVDEAKAADGFGKINLLEFVGHDVFHAALKLQGDSYHLLGEDSDAYDKWLFYGRRRRGRWLGDHGDGDYRFTEIQLIRAYQRVAERIDFMEQVETGLKGLDAATRVAVKILFLSIYREANGLVGLRSETQIPVAFSKKGLIGYLSWLKRAGVEKLFFDDLSRRCRDPQDLGHPDLGHDPEGGLRRGLAWLAGFCDFPVIALL